MFRYLILGLLRGGNAHHGYALMKGYGERSGLKVSAGNFYRELQRLVGEHLIHLVDNPADVDTRRAPYQITAHGAAAFDAWLAQPLVAAAPYGDDEISARSLFIGGAGAGVVSRVLDRWRDDLWLRSKMLERHREAVRSRQRIAASRFEPLALMLARRLKHVAADLEFVDEFRTAYVAHIQGRQVTSVQAGSRTTGPVDSPPKENRAARSHRLGRRRE